MAYGIPHQPYDYPGADLGQSGYSSLPMNSAAPDSPHSFGNLAIIGSGYNPDYVGRKLWPDSWLAVPGSQDIPFGQASTTPTPAHSESRQRAIARPDGNVVYEWSLAGAPTIEEKHTAAGYSEWLTDRRQAAQALIQSEGVRQRIEHHMQLTANFAAGLEKALANTADQTYGSQESRSRSDFQVDRIMDGLPRQATQPGWELLQAALNHMEPDETMRLRAAVAHAVASSGARQNLDPGSLVYATAKAVVGDFVEKNPGGAQFEADLLWQHGNRAVALSNNLPEDISGFAGFLIQRTLRDRPETTLRRDRYDEVLVLSIGHALAQIPDFKPGEMSQAEINAMAEKLLPIMYAMDGGKFGRLRRASDQSSISDADTDKRVIIPLHSESDIVESDDLPPIWMRNTEVPPTIGQSSTPADTFIPFSGHVTSSPPARSQRNTLIAPVLRPFGPAPKQSSDSRHALENTAVQAPTRARPTARRREQPRPTSNRPVADHTSRPRRRQSDPRNDSYNQPRPTAAAGNRRPASASRHIVTMPDGQRGQQPPRRASSRSQQQAAGAISQNRWLQQRRSTDLW